MTVIDRGVSGLPDSRNRLAAFDTLATPDQQGGVVCIQRLHSVTVVQDDGLTVPAQARPAVDDAPVCTCNHGLAAAGADIDAAMPMRAARGAVA